MASGASIFKRFSRPRGFRQLAGADLWNEKIPVPFFPFFHILISFPRETVTPEQEKANRAAVLAASGPQPLGAC
jgi:hypothetical protein